MTYRFRYKLPLGLFHNSLPTIIQMPICAPTADLVPERPESILTFAKSGDLMCWGTSGVAPGGPAVCHQNTRNLLAIKCLEKSQIRTVDGKISESNAI